MPDAISPQASEPEPQMAQQSIPDDWLKPADVAEQPDMQEALLPTMQEALLPTLSENDWDSLVAVATAEEDDGWGAIGEEVPIGGI